MAFKIESIHLNGLTVIAPDVFKDDRGFFMEAFRADYFDALGLPSSFPQDNHSRSVQGVLRGMHFQWEPPQGKLVRVTVGRAFLAMVDIRKNSPTLGKWCSFTFSAEERKLVWVPPGFANGFCALSDVVEIQYKCTAIYSKNSEGSILWNDPAIGIQWPLANPILSPKDEKGMTLSEWLAKPEADCFRYDQVKSKN
ncbi:MAG: dTDP-4-dehydrorhamnose 3,5-epimerase [Bacteroidetes bacterium]|nr:MAG: dTDP-4-dehydrorhamnose 3,5-epimerase [Bacteroidota bacterium]